MAALDLTRPFEPDVSEWEPWDPGEVARRLVRVDAPWYIIAGWSLDLFRGRQTREHEDIELAVPDRDFPAIRDALAGFDLYAIADGQAAPADEDSLSRSHQTWVRDPVAGRWRLDVIREPWDGDTWICRRHPAIRRPRSEVVAHTADGIPYQQPEIALLFKAKHVREKDQTDFDGVLPLLDRTQRAWLADALRLVHPGHPWLERLGGRASSP